MNEDKQAVFPALRYRDAAAAIEFLRDAFGFELSTHYQHQGLIAHAEMTWGTSRVMLASVNPNASVEIGNAGVYVVVDDPDKHFEKAKAAGAEILRPVADQPYGSRDYAALDLEGNVWSFGTYQP